jgi:hypothetical protein
VPCVYSHGPTEVALLPAQGTLGMCCAAPGWLVPVVWTYTPIMATWLVLLLVGLPADPSATASSPFSAGPFPSIVRCVHVQLFLQQACLCAACAWACLLLQLPGWGSPHQPAPT